MKLLKFLFPIICCVGIIFSACKKEADYTARKSYGSLKDSSGTCLNNTPHGDYKAGTSLVSTNYIDFHVKIDSVGTYSISTDTINGYSFKGTGTFGVKGDTLVRLYGYGTPQFGGTNVFQVMYGASSCSATVTVTGTAASPATFTLNIDTSSTTLPVACSGAIVEGAYATRIATTINNTATLQVNVTKIGGYNVSVPSQNGLIFAGTGVFTTTGIHSLVLTATGTPAMAGDYNYTATVNGVSCTFTVTVSEGPAAAVFTLGGSPSVCTGFVVAGTYVAGAALTSANTVSCQVNVTIAGSYSITTNTLNGIHFSGTGTFTSTGANTVILTGSGTPTAAATNNYIVSASTGNCSFSITTDAPITTASVFTLNGSGSSCTGAISAGTYTVGSSLSTANTLSIQVNVTTKGIYTISTNSVNGISFSRSGTFTSLGVQTVALIGTGTPITAGTYNYTVSAGSNNCTFSVTTTSASSNSCTGLTDNKFELSNGINSIGTPTGAVNQGVVAYHVTVNAVELVLSFGGITQLTAGQTYALGNNINIIYFDINTLATWSANTGQINVSAGTTAGTLNIEFCNILFTKTGTTSTAIGKGKFILLP